MSNPKNWPPSFPYLKSPLHDALTPTHLLALRTKPPVSSIPSIPASSTLTPSPNVKIQLIKDASHPAHGQHGLFATQNLQPSQFILAYLGRVHTGARSDDSSDYDLWIDRDADLAVDASREGNEGRYVNDYRGVRERANAVFGAVWCERWGELCVGIWAVGGKGIRKGDEILVSYGKGFWEKRSTDGQTHGGGEGEAS
ncbi:hypothetical protein QQS21_010640 [Conoideocrella luteorostrata]|uniref:SET domain-containing protein n=1 Tax=Conoideocrella luteorostrata TaxID=1105319 RepID=A0AAJ0CEW9_9HYPO|nr:hypothetical protein QQS21_010640 [Conoideocrella luteorostrata]